MCSDPNSPICQRWAKLGGMETLGATVSGPTLTADGRATFQEFTNGALFLTSTGVYSVARSIFDKWQSLAAKNALDGTNLRDFVGYPTGDDLTFTVEAVPGGVPNVMAARVAPFERGFIVAYDLLETTKVLVYGKFYEAYLSSGLVDGGVGVPLADKMANSLDAGRMGLPLADEEAVGSGGFTQRFQRADLYLASPSAANAFIVFGPIRARWQKLGGVNSPLGFPTLNVLPVFNLDGVVLGQVQLFFGGSIYESQETGAWEVLPPIRDVYNSPARGGPMGPLGFPISGQLTSPTGLTDYNNFQNGVIVWRRDGSRVGELPPPGVTSNLPRVVLGLQFFVPRFAGTGGDEIVSSGLAMFVNSTVASSNGVIFNGRLPGPPYFISANSFFGAEAEVNLTFPIQNPIRGGARRSSASIFKGRIKTASAETTRSAESPKATTLTPIGISTRASPSWPTTPFA